MAYIDKIYGSREQWIELWDFLYENCPDYLDAMGCFPDKESLDARIAHFSEKQNSWLAKNCPLEFIQNRLKEQYGDTIETCRGNK